MNDRNPQRIKSKDGTLETLDIPNDKLFLLIVLNIPDGDDHFGNLKIYFDGRDPEILGQVLMLPRRERRILEYLAANRMRRVNRSLIFNAVYGLFDEEVEESVVESHISKLRKKLKHALGYDPIDTKRYLGYQLVGPNEAAQANAVAADVDTGFAVTGLGFPAAPDLLVEAA